MQRKARPRSGSPRFIVAFGTPFTIFGTIGGIDRITTGTVVVGNGCTVAFSTGSIMIGVGVGTVVGIAGGADSTLWSCRATR